ncbi:MAG: heptaprenyl diphosphate synthase [Dethiosulfovibrio peptidovorans]|nr:MAG: heptaprenyl diphosphate synthase [Dethiosulfovibrio peptidovorans]
MTRISLLTVLALLLFIVELQFPVVVPVPGVKLGLANVVTVFAVFVLGFGDAFAVVVLRVLLGGFLSGQVMAVVFSMAGGLVSLGVLLCFRPLLSNHRIWIASALSAVAHNVGQLGVAVIITRTPGLLAYLPVLVISGILAGACTGLLAQIVVRRLT